MTGRMAQLWGGPMDGLAVWMPDGDLPPRVGVHTGDHVQVYERPPLAALRDPEPPWPAGSDDRPVYVHRDLATRWLARQ